MAEFYNHMGGALNPDLDKLVAQELHGDDKKPEEKKKKTWHRKLNRAIDKVLTHPIVEAGKTAGRFIPGVGIFMIGVDRLTRWKLTYSNNEAMVATLEKKMSDITITYIALVELLPPKERREDNPRLQIFSKRAEQVKRLVALIQRSIDDYSSKNEKERLGMAEVIQSSFASLQKVLDELQRDIELHLGMQTTAGIQAQGRKMDGMVDILRAQRSILESQAERNDKLLALVQRQIQAADHIQTAIAQLKDDLTPGYAKVENLEIRRVWWDFFRWPAAMPTKDVLVQMPQYFKMQRDPVALLMWSHLQKGDLLCVEDLGLDPEGVVTPFDLNEAFPYDPVYEITLGDWLVWRALGWIFLAAELERSILPLRNKFIQSSTIVSQFISFVSATLQRLREQHGYGTTVHARLLDISVRAVSSALPPFADRFQSFLDALTDSIDILKGSYDDSKLVWLDPSVQETLAQSLATMQWRLNAEAQELGIEAPDVWDPDEVAQWMATDQASTQQAHNVGSQFATGVWNKWNGSSALVSPHALDRMQKLGPRTLLAILHGVEPVVLKPLAMATAPEHAVLAAVEAAANAAASWNVCRGLVSTHGVTLAADCWMAVVEYCERGDFRSAISSSADSKANTTAPRLPLPAKLKALVQVATAIRFMHTRGLAHKQLTSAHIYLTDGFAAKIGGLFPGPLDADVLRYRSPESLTWDTVHASSDSSSSSPTEADWQKNDVFALGQVVFEALRGERPFYQTADSDMAGIKRAIAAFDARQAIGSLPHGIPADLLDLIQSALATQPSERPTISEFCATLESIYARQRQNSQESDLALVWQNPVARDVEPPTYEATIQFGTLAPKSGAHSMAASLALEEIQAVEARIADPSADLAAVERDLRKLSSHHPRALFHLGDLYYYDHSDRGVPHDFRRALDCYSEALEAGEAVAAVGVGDCYYFGHGGSAKQPGLARDMYLRAMPAVATMSEKYPGTAARIHAGIGDVHYDAQEYVSALDHYYRAIELSDACKRAWARIGDAHLYGRGTQVDPDHARKCYRKAKGTRREVEGMIEFYRARGEYAFANMYISDPILSAPDY